MPPSDSAAIAEQADDARDADERRNAVAVCLGVAGYRRYTMLVAMALRAVSVDQLRDAQASLAALLAEKPGATQLHASYVQALAQCAARRADATGRSPSRQAQRRPLGLEVGATVRGRPLGAVLAPLLTDAAAADDVADALLRAAMKNVGSRQGGR